jgi:diaminohydroxyphosphoribosylaminopyrimidine deaminase/5-amino-6-(5-phosphoribosylamino)uracil reductase
MTLNGKIASPNPREKWITSPQSRKEVQRMRHASDALLTGMGTVLADDPLLTDRTGLPRRRRLLRVVLDSRLRLPLRSKLVKSARGDVLIFTAARESSPRARRLRDAGVEVVQVPGRRGKLDLKTVLRELGRWEILSVLLECGARLNGAALEGGVVDKLVLFYAPKVLGPGALPMMLPGTRQRLRVPAMEQIRLGRFGPDVMVEGYLCNVYGNH